MKTIEELKKEEELAKAKAEEKQLRDSLESSIRYHSRIALGLCVSCGEDRHPGLMCSGKEENRD